MIFNVSGLSSTNLEKNDDKNLQKTINHTNLEGRNCSTNHHISHRFRNHHTTFASRDPHRSRERQISSNHQNQWFGIFEPHPSDSKITGFSDLRAGSKCTLNLLTCRRHIKAPKYHFFMYNTNPKHSCCSEGEEINEKARASKSSTNSPMFWFIYFEW